ncbi:unnamed protein product [Gongylonema pulchrum]|uniref:5-formyltetrahydrofolate cyclo-ligase n=1 Tax=Gongylonema pulchrum TaxID=637853 RepID=A0A183DJU9_9BILA|nr:unnamed protein product [Gongylonema pulchrum]
MPRRRLSATERQSSLERQRQLAAERNADIGHLNPIVMLKEYVMQSLTDYCDPIRFPQLRWGMLLMNPVQVAVCSKQP